MKFTLEHVKGEPVVELPDHTVVLTAEDKYPVQDTYIAIIKSLLQPLGYKRTLFDMGKECNKACVAVDTILPPNTVDLVIRPLLKTLHAAGLAYEEICLLLAAEYPLNLPTTDASNLLAEDIRQNYHIEFHHPENESLHQLAGETKSGTKVYLDKRFLSADMKIAVGHAMPHFAAGFFDATSLVALGTSNPMTINSLYSPSIVDHPNSQPGVYKGNPLQQEILEIASLAEINFIVNIVTNYRQDVSSIFSGAVKRTHQTSMKGMLDEYAFHIEQKFDVALATVGYPYKENWYLNAQTLCNVKNALVEDGMIILVTDGLKDLQKSGILNVETLDELKSILNRGRVLDNLLNKLTSHLSRTHVCFVSGFNHTIKTRQKIEPDLSFVSTVNEAIQLAVKQYGQDFKFAAIPEGLASLYNLS